MRARTEPSARRWLERMAWLGLFWAAGVTVMCLVALLLRALMRAAGLAS
jgi:hypothetical protein